MTIRRQIIEILKKDSLNALDLSKLIGVREREVYDHLAHIQRTITSKKVNFIITPSRCLTCGYDFKQRSRLTKPGRCPLCKGTRLTRPKYRIE
jgi:predicted Zn-ribbon and HTH transcriptional regulator